MKKLILLFAVIIFASCSSDDDNVRLDQPDAITIILPEGNWKISKFIEDDEDKTLQFTSFVFDFNNDGTVTAQNDLFSENGSWSYDNDRNDPELDIRFNDGSIHDDISDDWNIISVSPTKIELSDTDSVGDVELLTFIKI